MDLPVSLVSSGMAFASQDWTFFEHAVTILDLIFAFCTLLVIGVWCPAGASTLGYAHYTGRYYSIIISFKENQGDSMAMCMLHMFMRSLVVVVTFRSCFN